MNIKKVLLQAVSHRPVRYVLVGAWNTALGYTLFVISFLLASRAGLSKVPAGECALIVTNAIALAQGYCLFKFIVFRTPHLSWLEFFRFSSVCSVQVGANLVMLPLLVKVAHLHPLTAQVILIPVFVLCTYLAHHHISFRRRNPPKPAPIPTLSNQPRIVIGSDSLKGVYLENL